jgi:hypothetical protein
VQWPVDVRMRAEHMCLSQIGCQSAQPMVQYGQGKPWWPDECALRVAAQRDLRPAACRSGRGRFPQVCHGPTCDCVLVLHLRWKQPTTLDLPQVDSTCQTRAKQAGYWMINPIVLVLQVCPPTGGSSTVKALILRQIRQPQCAGIKHYISSSLPIHATE